MGTRINLVVTGTSVASSVAAGIVKMWDPLDPVNSFLRDLATTLRTWYASFLEAIVTLITTVATPTPEMLATDFFSVALGGTYGLARILVALVAVAISIIVILTPSLRHGVKMRKVVTSMVMVVLFGYLFYPIYSLLYNLSKGFVEAIVDLVTNGNDDITRSILGLFGVVNIADTVNTIIATGISGIFGIFIVGNAVGLWLMATMLLLFYPLAIAVRPFGEFGNRLFNLFNAAIMTTLISPPIVVFAFMLPVFAQEHFSAISVVATPLLAVVGSLIAMGVPIVIFFLSYKKSSEVFGRLDDGTGKFDIGQMPPVSVEDVKNDVKVTNNSSVLAIAADVAGDSMLYGEKDGSLFDNMAKTAVNVGATAAAAAGHPLLGTGIKAAGGVYERARNSGGTETTTESNQGGES